MCHCVIMISVMTRRAAMLGGVAACVARPSVALPQYSFWQGLEFVDQAGTAFQIGAMKSPLVFVNVWANWCGACLSEMVSIASLAAKLPPGQLDVLLLSHPDNWLADQAAAARRRLPFRLATLSPSNPAWSRPAAFEERGRTYTVPRSLVYRRASDSVVMAQEGATQWDSAANIRRLESLLLT